MTERLEELEVRMPSESGKNLPADQPQYRQMSIENPAVDDAAKRAVRHAIALHHFEGRSVTIMRGDRMIELMPDGTERPVDVDNMSAEYEEALRKSRERGANPKGIRWSIEMPGVHEAAARAVKHAIALHHFEGRSVAIMRGDKIVRLMPDGRELSIEEADRIESKLRRP